MGGGMQLHSATLSRKVEPLGLRRPDAAAYLGISPSTFDEWVESRLMPRPRRVGGVVVWDREELADAFRAIPREGEIPQDAIWDNVKA